MRRTKRNGTAMDHATINHEGGNMEDSEDEWMQQSTSRAGMRRSGNEEDEEEWDAEGSCNNQPRGGMRRTKRMNGCNNQPRGRE